MLAEQPEKALPQPTVPTFSKGRYQPVRPEFLGSLLSDMKCNVSRLLQVAALPVPVNDGEGDRAEKENESWRIGCVWEEQGAAQRRGVYQCRVLGDEICQQLIEEMRNIKKYFPNAPLDHNGIILNKFGFARKLTYFSQLLGPLIRKQYGLAENCLIQTTQALVVRYQAGESHQVHIDDSDYTLNICLGESFGGGDLCFYTNECVDGEEEEANGRVSFGVKHAAGYGTLHNGGLAHSANALSEGSRFNLVLWFNVHTAIEFRRIPEDVRRVIISCFDVLSLVAFGQTSQAHRELCRSKELWPVWRRHYRENFVEYPNLPFLREENVTFKEYTSRGRVELSENLPPIAYRSIEFEQQVTQFCPERDWCQYYIDATMRRRKNFRLLRKFPLAPEGSSDEEPLLEMTVPSRLAMLQAYRPTSYKEERFQYSEPVPPQPSPLFLPLRPKKKCAPRYCEYKYVFNIDLVSSSEVGEFFDVDLAFFQNPDNRIYYERG